ncbi:MAG: hypothetical protein WC340_18045 [Kiritimatiellia bacterium]
MTASFYIDNPNVKCSVSAYSTSLILGDELIVAVDKESYLKFRRNMAKAMCLIVPEDAAQPEHVVATLGQSKTAVLAAV